MSSIPRTALTGVPSGAVSVCGTPKKARKYSEAVSSSISGPTQVILPGPVRSSAAWAGLTRSEHQFLLVKLGAILAPVRLPGSGGPEPEPPVEGHGAGVAVGHPQRQPRRARRPCMPGHRLDKLVRHPAAAGLGGYPHPHQMPAARRVLPPFGEGGHHPHRLAVTPGEKPHRCPCAAAPFRLVEAELAAHGGGEGRWRLGQRGQPGPPHRGPVRGLRPAHGCAAHALSPARLRGAFRRRLPSSLVPRLSVQATAPLRLAHARSCVRRSWVGRSWGAWARRSWAGRPDGGRPDGCQVPPETSAPNGGAVADTFTSTPGPLLRIACWVPGGTNTSVPSDTSRSSPPTSIWPRPRTITYACSCAGWACSACWLPGWHSTQVTHICIAPSCPAPSSR